MAEILQKFATVLVDDGGGSITRERWAPRCPMARGMRGLVVPSLEPCRSFDRETTQPNRQDTVYWSTDSPVYLEGSPTHVETLKRSASHRGHGGIPKRRPVIQTRTELPASTRWRSSIRSLFMGRASGSFESAGCSIRLAPGEHHQATTSATNQRPG